MAGPEAFEYERTLLLSYATSITMDPFGVPAGIHRAEDPWALDPADECSHGRLSGDRTPVCGCWVEEGAVVLELFPVLGEELAA